MSWAEYTVADLDLTEESPIPSSRPYRQGRRSLDDLKIFVRFIGGEVPWPGGLVLDTRAAARAVIQSPDYVTPPTQEELDMEEEARKDNLKYRLRTIVDRKRESKFTKGVTLAGYVQQELEKAALEVRAGGDQAGNAIIDELVTRFGQNITRVVDNILQDASDMRAFMVTSEALLIAGERAINRDEDVTALLEEVRAL